MTGAIKTQEVKDLKEGEVLVTVRNQSGFTMELAVQSDAKVSELFETVHAEVPTTFPRVDSQGRMVHYSIENTRTGTYLNPNETFEEAGVKTGDILELHPRPIAM